MKKLIMVMCLVLCSSAFGRTKAFDPIDDMDVVNKRYVDNNTVSFSTDLSDSIVDDATIHLGAGTYSLGAYDFTNSNVTIIGRGSEKTVIKGNFNIYPSASNFVARGVNFAADNEADDVFIFQAHTTNYMGTVFDDVLISGGTNALANTHHGLQVSGSDISLSEVKSVSGHYHPFVLKGVSNCVVRSCSSGDAGYSGLLLKASSDRGNNYDVVISDFISQNKLWVESYDDGTINTNILVESSSFTGEEATDYVMTFGNSASAIGTRAVYVTVKNCEWRGGKGMAVIGATGQINVSGLSGSCDNAFITSASASEIVCNFDAVSMDRFNVDSASINTYDCAVPYSRSFATSDVSSGAEVANIRCEGSTSTSAVIVVSAGYEPKESVLVAGDPIWCYGSYGAGVHRLVSWGTVTTADDPVSGALVGDFWFSLDTTSSVTGNDYRFGKDVCTVAGVAVGNRRFSVFAEADGYNTPSLEWSRGSEYNSFTVTTSTMTSVGGVDTDSFTGAVELFAHSYDEDAVCYVGVFGGAGDDADVPSTFSTATLKVTVRGNYTNWLPDFQKVD